MIHHKSIILGLFLFSTFTLQLIAQDLLDYSNTLKYANYLFQDKQFELAAIEYERASYLNPDDTVAKLKLVQSFRLTEDYEKAKSKVKLLFNDDQANFPEAFAIEYFRILFYQNKFEEANHFIGINHIIRKSKRIEFELGSLLMQYKWEEAKLLGESYLSFDSQWPKLQQLYNISLIGLESNHIRPGIAAFLSGIIPGLGKVYSKRYRDAIFSFVVISSAAVLTYNSIKENGLKDISIIYSTISLSFYSANIFGSYKSATEYNRKINQRTIETVEDILFEN